jgi:protocatechuate 3,4-dioxygenase beta subunit
MPWSRDSLNRREALQRLSVLGVGAVVSACGSDGDTANPTATPRASTPTPDAPTLAPATDTPAITPTQAAPTATRTPSPTSTVTPSDIACILTPEETLGPFFIDVGLARSDIREDRAGIPLRLVLQLADIDGCTPIRDAVVNIWHTDAAGLYSGFPNQPGGIDTTGETFLRGFQMTDANGRVEFTTIYPGWYPGRTVHIHARIHLDATTVLVTQVYFPDTVTDAVLTQAPYSDRPNRDTTNATDSIARNDLDELLLDIVEEDGGYTASIVFGVARSSPRLGSPRRTESVGGRIS